MSLTERSLTIEDHEDFEEAYQRNLKQLAEEKEEEEKKKQLEVPDELQPNGTLLKPLDEVTNIVILNLMNCFLQLESPHKKRH